MGFPLTHTRPGSPILRTNVVCRLSVMNASICAFGSLHISSKSSVPHSASCFFTPARLQIVVKTNRHGRVFCHFNKCTRAGYIYERATDVPLKRREIRNRSCGEYGLAARRRAERLFHFLTDSSRINSTINSRTTLFPASSTREQSGQPLTDKGA